ncbi:proteoglycan 4 [Euwallacea similis]|uniref:proteoglycan 4 n=1 Tax=Euwallacea similis TaxID=1736056 RepID=UPI00344F7B7F
MIPRENKWMLLTITYSIFVVHIKAQGERAYDTSEWIPITPKNYQGSASEIVELRQAPNERVLNLEAPVQKFLPEHEYNLRKQRKPEQFLRETPLKKVLDPRPRKLKFPAEYKFETPPPPPAKGQPQLNYYNGQQLSPYVEQQSAYAPLQQPSEPYVPVPSVNPKVPSPDAPSLYEKYQLPFNSSFYHSLNPTSINNEFYQAIGNRSEKRPIPLNPAAIPSGPAEQESVQLVYVPVENLRPNFAEQPDSKASELRIPLENFSASGPAVREQKFVYSTPASAPSNLNNFQNSEKAQLIPKESIYSTSSPLPSYQIPSFPTQQKTEFNYNAPLTSYPSAPKQQKFLARPLVENDEKAVEQALLREQKLYNTPSYQDPLFRPAEKQQIREQKLLFNPSTESTRPLTYNAPTSLPLYREPDFSPDKQSRLESIQKDYLQQSLQAHKLQQQFRDDINPLKQQEAASTTKKPKLKPHQPPLAVFLESHDKAGITDVLNVLRGAKSISVQDSISANSPKIFIGPSNLDSPGYYTKFPLPYLNNINGNRIERKIDQLPFFVAPVSYETPTGYSKIPLPAPHVGSVVVSVPQAKPIEPPQYSSNLETYEVFSPQSTSEANPYLNPVKEILTQSRPQEYYVPQVNKAATQQPQLPNVSPIDVAIKEYELHQINEDLNEQRNHNKVKHSTTRRPQQERTRSRYSYEEEVSTTERNKARIRGRGRSTTTTSTSTTTSTTPTPPPAVADPDEKYTVLEEFEVKSPVTPPLLREQVTDPPRRSTTPFSANRYLPEEYFETGRSQSPVFDYELPKFDLDKTTEIETIPANVFNLGPSSDYFKKSPYEIDVSTEKYKETTAGHRFRPTEVTNYENREPNQGRTSAQPSYSFEVDDDDISRPLYRQPETYERPPVTSRRPETYDPLAITNTQPDIHERPLVTNREPEIHERPLVTNRQSEIYDASTTTTPIAADQKAKQSAIHEPESHQSFLNTLYQPSFDETYISLQDQAVRSLLVPNLLAPSTKPQSTPSSKIEPEVFTEEVTVLSSTTEVSTTTRANRIRGRGRSRITTSTTEPPRRAHSVERSRRPAGRVSASSERPVVSSESLKEEVPQRFRTRGRPLQNDISTTERELYREPISERTFEPANSREQQAQPNEVDILPTVTSEPEINYQQFYNVQTTTTEQQPLEYDNTKTTRPAITELQTDVPDQRRAEFVPKRVEEPIVRYTIKSGGVLNNNAPITTTTEAPIRGRGRGRSRFATTTPAASSAARVTARPSSTPARAVSSLQKPEEEQEFFGFIRQPGYSPSNLNIQASKKPDESSNVRFVGEIRPKYTPRTTTPKFEEEETPKPRIRARTRASTRKTTPNNEEKSQEHHVTKRPGVTRTRGRSHYKPQENVKRESEDEDVAGQNYPVNFLQKLDATTVREAEDQAAHASFYTPTYLPHPNSLVTTAYGINEEPLALAIGGTTTQSSQEINLGEDKKSKRRGSWRLVKSRPADPLDVSESQNYQSVINAFDRIEKLDYPKKTIELEITTEAQSEDVVTTPPSPAKAQENIFDTIYEMFGVFAKNASKDAETATTTVTAPLIFPEEITEDPTTTTSLEETTETATVPLELATEPKQVEISTSTSTEVSHETEICYKGRCVKSKDKKKKLL